MVKKWYNNNPEALSQFREVFSILQTTPHSMKPIIPEKFVIAGFWTLVGSVIIAVLTFSVIRYGEAKEQAGIEKAVRAYEGGIVRLEHPNRMYATGKDVPDVQLHFGLFVSPQVSSDGKYFVLDEDEELPIAATLPPPKP